MGASTPQQTCNIYTAFGSRTTVQYRVWWRQKKICKGDTSLEDEKYRIWPLEVDNDQLRAMNKADSRTTTQEVTKELSVAYI